MEQTMQQTTNTPISGVPNTPKPPTPMKNNISPSPIHTSSATSEVTAIFTKDQKQNVFGDKIYERVFTIFNDIVPSQHISNKILDLNEQDIMAIMVDEIKFKSTVNEYKIEHDKIMELLNTHKEECTGDSAVHTVYKTGDDKCSICLDI